MRKLGWVATVLITGVVSYGIYHRILPTLQATEQRGVGQVQTEHSTERSSISEPTYNIVTLLPPDAIPAIDHPTFVTGAEADEQYLPDELVLGIEINGDARAYSIPFLSGHEIVNDIVGGEPIAVTW